VHYRYQHGQGELNFDHPHFKNPEDHARIVREAFRKKYQTHGPGILNMAITALRGYLRVREEFEERNRQGLAWNPQTLCYEKADSPAPDRFMKQRIRAMRRIAFTYRPALLAAWTFAPNRPARERARNAMELYNETFGKPKTAERLRSAALVGTGALEFARIYWGKLRGREGIVRQPPTKRTEYARTPRIQAADWSLSALTPVVLPPAELEES